MKKSSLLGRTKHDNLPMFVRADNIYLYTEDGKKIIDGCSNSMNVNLGYGRDDLAEVIERQARLLPFMHNKKGNTKVQNQLSNKLTSMLLPKKFRCYFCSNGSDTIETAMRIAFTYNKSQNLYKNDNFISFKGSYHGSSLAALSITGCDKVTEKYQGYIKKYTNLNFPNCSKCINKNACSYSCIDKNMIKNSIAIIADGMITNSYGCRMLPKNYLNYLAKLCRKYNTILIMDEIATSIGRTGKNFSFEYFDFIPDIICISKGLGVGYANLGAVLVSENITNKLNDYNLLGHTYNGNPISCAVGLKALEIIKNERILENVKSMEIELKTGLSKLTKFDVVEKVRGKGLMFSVSFDQSKINDDFLNQLINECFTNGLLVLGANLKYTTHITVAPPLIITKNQINEICQIIYKSIENLLKERKYNND